LATAVSDTSTPFWCRSSCSASAGVFSITRGAQDRAPEPINVPWVPIGVLLIAIVLESISLRTALGESAPDRRDQHPGVRPEREGP